MREFDSFKITLKMITQKRKNGMGGGNEDDEIIGFFFLFGVCVCLEMRYCCCSCNVIQYP